jgi:hypothetical protein
MGNDVSMDNIRKALDERLGDKLGLGAEKMKMLGGFLDIFEEGSSIYASKKEAILNTGKLLDSIIGTQGDEGLLGRLANISEDSFKYFGRINEGVEATNALTKGLKSFVMTSKDQQSELINQAALFKKLGVEMSDFTAVIDSARLGFKMTGKEAAQLSRDIAQIGQSTGVGMGEAMSNFSKAQSSMAYSSGKLMDNFRALQLTSAQTGVGFDKLTSAFGESMDTFEGSASKAGSLNAILGRSVFNSIDLLGKTEAQRVETIIQGIKKNVNVEALGRNKFQLKAVAQGLGLSPDETRRLLTGQMTVDQVLSQKESTDPREVALRQMAKLLTDNVNPSLDTFNETLKSMRTAEGQAVVSFNVMMRKQMKKLSAGAGVDINSPAQLYETIQQALRDVARRGSAADLKDRGAEIAGIFKNLKTNLDNPKMDKETAIRTMFNSLGPKLKEIMEAQPTDSDSALVPATQAKNNAAQLNNIQAKLAPDLASVLKVVRDSLDFPGKKLTGSPDIDLVGGGTKMVLQVGTELFDAVLRLAKVGDGK